MADVIKSYAFPAKIDFVFAFYHMGGPGGQRRVRRLASGGGTGPGRAAADSAKGAGWGLYTFEREMVRQGVLPPEADPDYARRRKRLERARRRRARAVEQSNDVGASAVSHPAAVREATATATATAAGSPRSGGGGGATGGSGTLTASGASGGGGGAGLGGRYAPPMSPRGALLSGTAAADDPFGTSSAGTSTAAGVQPSRRAVISGVASVKRGIRALPAHALGPWRVYDNASFSLCPTYPARVVVPSTCEDALITAAAAFRSKGRLPALTWLHPS